MARREEDMSQRDLVARPLEPSDIAQMVEIERLVYEDPWSQNLLEQSLTAPMTHTLGYFRDGKCLAYSIYQVVFTEAHLLNLAVAKNFQRQGMGRSLLDLVMKDSERKGAVSIFLEVRPSNKAALELYGKCGFKTLMVREKYYSNGESAFVMVCELMETE